ncbi:MAG: hypothetical protein BWX74_00127 [Tenericutes bacterium ADurb.Bin087]|nr:MAG: hypothetical protein BWX74_00127 [Tenericutes bacterium ADurb.Bin087]
MMDEATLHKIIKENKEVQNRLLELLEINENGIVFNSEDQYPNGLFADFSIIENTNKVRAIIELKGSNIGANEYVRGTGQLLQYQHFIDNNLSTKNYDFSQAIAVLCFPSTLISDQNYNIGLFGYPDKSLLVEFNEENYTFRKITKKDLNVFAGSRGKDMVTISPYYIRDTRVFEIYIALKFFQILKLAGYQVINRKQAEAFLRQLDTPDNGNWRNVFITLSSLGLTDHLNIPTRIGAKYADMSFEEFAYEIYNSYIKNYFSLLLSSVLTFSNTNCNISLDQLRNAVNNFYAGKDVLFMTDSGTRYLSSWLNIMQDDYGCISFPAKKNIREYKIIYPIDKYNKKAIMEEIKKNTTLPYFFINKFNSLISTKI